MEAIFTKQAPHRTAIHLSERHTQGSTKGSSGLHHHAEKSAGHHYPHQKKSGPDTVVRPHLWGLWVCLVCTCLWVPCGVRGGGVAATTSTRRMRGPTRWRVHICGACGWVCGLKILRPRVACVHFLYRRVHPPPYTTHHIKLTRETGGRGGEREAQHRPQGAGPGQGKAGRGL